MNGTGPSTSFRLAYVPGATPGKWARTWQERLPGVPLELVAVSAAEAAGTLRDGGADAALVRLPIERTGLSAIPLYTEATVVLVPKDHEVAGVDEVAVADLGDYVVLHPVDDCLDWSLLPGRPAQARPATTADAVELVAAGAGLLVVPQSLARLHHRRDLTYRPVPDAPQSQIALSWPEERTTDQVEDLIGIVRGRTANSSRGRTQTPPDAKAKAKKKPDGSAKSASSAKSAGAAGAGRKSASGSSGSRGSGGARGAKRGGSRRGR